MAAPLQDGFGLLAHEGPWTLDDWLALPPTHARVELVDGMLVVSPYERFVNARLGLRIARQLFDAAPDGLEAMQACNAAISGTGGLIPDFAVIDLPGYEGVALTGDHFVLVGEIASPSTRRYDRTTKRDMYAEAGVRYLMFVDPGRPASAELLELRAGTFVEIARSANGLLRAQRPFPLALDLRLPPPPPS